LSQPQAVDAAFAAQAADVRAAAARLRGRAVVTPLLDYPSISARGSAFGY
jgi:threonine dehydratase